MAVVGSSVALTLRVRFITGRDDYYESLRFVGC
jgi:hypothetical protein